MQKECTSFLDAHNITAEEFAETGLSWEELVAIKKDYESIRDELTLIARYIEEKLQAFKYVHLLRYRCKDPDHLVAKIIRKKIEDPARIITVDNYKESITDLIGIRAIHLFKEDWLHIHRFVRNTWKLHETPIAYIRSGDVGAHTEEYKKHNFDIQPHRHGYRSIHYLIEAQPGKDKYIAELQVRTIFEEGWSEIDHMIMYPKKVTDPLLDNFLDVFNILAGNSDQMGSFVRTLKDNLIQGTETIAHYKELTEKHAGIIDSLTKRVKGTVGELKARTHRVEERIHLLAASGTPTNAFTKVLNQTENTVITFRQLLNTDPERAAAVFESTAQKLDRIERLLDIMLENNDPHEDETDEQMLAHYKIRSNHFFKNMQLIADLEPSLVPIVAENTPDDTSSFAELERAMKEIKTRNQFTKFILGPGYGNLNLLLQETQANRIRIQALSVACTTIKDPAIQFVLQTQIDKFQAQKNKLKAFIERYQKTFSLFGWLARLTARRPR